MRSLMLRKRRTDSFGCEEDDACELNMPTSVIGT